MNGLRTLLRVPRSRFGVVLLAALLGTGCGGGKGEVSGTVTYQGKPLPLGTVTFMGTDNQSVGAAAITEGKYAMAKVPAGPVKIIVAVPPYSEDPRPRRQRKHFGKEPPKDVPASQAAPPPKFAPRFVIPEKYANPDQSGLTYTVQPGNQMHNIELE
jgi:hypothetical protein